MKKLFGCTGDGACACERDGNGRGQRVHQGWLVGGTAGHFAGHHGILGAAAGCVIGRHEASKAARRNRDDLQRRSTTGVRY